ncbi:MAG TPA: bifunctional methylenetetrahydrofolate dehydrogenase/methenyltetrahydrofolate cyclohydrolase, partial [Vicinamibacterales bacterium]|nr:bifunctional methylenetetrahydrofolate dehydrogenase/methenyltetrahydrofolate cyclohydrolase [Vicinamibacterales bacterium]
MPAVLMKGAPLAARIRAEVAKDVAELGHVGLATVLVGDDPASHIYVGHKHKAALEAGMESHDHRLAAETTADELHDLVQQLNEDDRVDGILVQLPLPTQLDGTAATRLVSPAKDVDGFHPVSAGQLYLGHPT